MMVSAQERLLLRYPIAQRACKLVCRVCERHQARVLLIGWVALCSADLRLA